MHGMRCSDLALVRELAFEVLKIDSMQEKKHSCSLQQISPDVFGQISFTRIVQLDASILRARQLRRSCKLTDAFTHEHNTSSKFYVGLVAIFHIILLTKLVDKLTTFENKGDLFAYMLLTCVQQNSYINCCHHVEHCCKVNNKP